MSEIQFVYYTPRLAYILFGYAHNGHFMRKQMLIMLEANSKIKTVDDWTLCSTRAMI